MDGQYGQTDVFIGSPAIINRQGIQNVIEIPLNDSEMDKMNLSAATLKKVTADAFAALDKEN